MQWNECLEQKSAKRISPDKKRAQALERVAKARLTTHQSIDERNANFVFEDYYTSLLETIQAIAFREGYNILNHLCIGAFLTAILNKPKLQDLFEQVRYKRNSLTYYGITMEYSVALEAIRICKKILRTLS